MARPFEAFTSVELFSILEFEFLSLSLMAFSKDSFDIFLNLFGHKLVTSFMDILKVPVM